MTPAHDILLHQLNSGQYLIEKMTADLSDADYFRLPIPKGNHVGWILGHIACSEDSINAGVTGSPKRLPDAMHELFKGGSECLSDASKYPPRKQIDEMFRNTRAHVLEALKKADVAEWSKPSPEGWDKSVFPTRGAIWALQGTHQYWHIGQLTLCRTAMGKKRALM